MSTPRHFWIAPALAAMALLLGATACIPAERPVEPANDDPPTMGAISSATFTGIYNEPVQLVRGRYEGLPPDPDAASRPVLELVVDLHAEGDLDGDGAPEAAVLLVEASGGTGSFVYLAAVSIRDGGPVNLGTGLVGDRVQVRHLAIDSGEIRLGLVAHASDDPQCCPTRVVEKRWVLEGGELVEAGSVDDGELGLGMLDGGRWRLDDFGDHILAMGDQAITLEFREGQAGGSAGCNRYSGTLSSDEPGHIRTGPVMSSRKACPERVSSLESAYLEAFGKVNRYSFRMGRLALSWADGDGAGTLLFRAARPEDGDREKTGPRAQASE